MRVPSSTCVRVCVISGVEKERERESAKRSASVYAGVYSSHRLRPTSRLDSRASFSLSLSRARERPRPLVPPVRSSGVFTGATHARVLTCAIRARYERERPAAGYSPSHARADRKNSRIMESYATCAVD